MDLELELRMVHAANCAYLIASHVKGVGGHAPVTCHNDLPVSISLLLRYVREDFERSGARDKVPQGQ